MFILKGLFKQDSSKVLERQKASGKDTRVYGNLVYRCRNCGKEHIVPKVPNADKIVYALINGNNSKIFSTCNFYHDQDTNIIYKENIMHNCKPGVYGYMEFVRGEILGQIFLSDENKVYDPSKERGF